MGKAIKRIIVRDRDGFFERDFIVDGDPLGVYKWKLIGDSMTLFANDLTLKELYLLGAMRHEDDMIEIEYYDN